MDNDLKPHAQHTLDWLGQIGLAVLVWLTASPSLVYAHGMAAGEDVSRPLALSGALALVSYWVVVLWPRRRKGGIGPF